MTTVLYDSGKLLDSIHISGSPLLSTGSTYPTYFIGPSAPAQFIAGHEYTIGFNAYCEKTNPDVQGQLDLYLVGDAFPSGADAASQFGSYVTTLIAETGSIKKLFERVEINVIAGQTNSAYIRFLLYGGDWYISDVSIAPANSTGYNPDQYSAYIALPQKQYQNLQFKAELYDINNNLVPIDIESSPTYFIGENTYIQGRNNRIQGSIILNPSGSGPVIGVSDSGSYIGIKAGQDSTELPQPIDISVLQSYVGPPIVTIYSGSTPFSQSASGSALGLQIAAGTPGGSFLDFNTITGQLTILGNILLLPNSPLSNSIVSISVSTASTSTSLDGQQALAQIQQIVSGTFPNGTYLNGKFISSPILIGNQGYISQSFGVGNISAGNGIILTAVGYSSSTGQFIPNDPAIYIGKGQFYNNNTPFFVASGSDGPEFSLGSYLAFMSSSTSPTLIVSGTLLVVSGTGRFVDVRNFVFNNTASLSSSINAQIASVSASQAAYTTVVSATLMAVSSAQAQDTGSIFNVSQSLAAQAVAFSASQAAYTTTVSASLISVSSSLVQTSASLISVSQSLAAQAVAYSASQASYTTTISASLISVSSSVVQTSASLISVSQSLAAQAVAFSASQASYTTTISASVVSTSASVQQTIYSSSVVDAVNKIKLPTSIKTVRGLYLETGSLGFWQPHPSGNGISSSNFPVVINESGQFRIANSASWTGSSTAGNFSEYIAFANNAFVVATKNLLLDTPGFQVAGFAGSASNANFLKLGSNASTITFTNNLGFYVDGAGNFRVGTDTSSSISSSFIEFSPSVGLIVSSSNFFLNASASQGVLKLTNNLISIGNPPPSAYNPQGAGAIGIYGNSAGQFFVGSGAVGSIAGTGTGSWISFGGTDLNIKTNKLFLSSNGLYIQGADSITGSANVIKLGTAGQNITLANNLGLYADGGGNFRVGTDSTGSSFIQFSTGNGIIISASNFALAANNAGQQVQVNNYYMAVGNPLPLRYNPQGAGSIGFYANTAGQLFIGSGAVGSIAGTGTGSWISFGGTDLNIKTNKLFLSSNGLYIQGADSIAAASNVIKLGSAGQNITLANNLGFYVDGAGNFRVGTDTSSSISSSFIEFVPNTGLIISSSNFFLNASASQGVLKLTNNQLALGNPVPTQYNPQGAGAIGIYANSAGQLFFGSGAVGAVAGAGTGSWVSFGGTDLNIKTNKLVLSSNGLFIQGADSLVPASNVIKLGAAGQNITLANNLGFYVDGAGNFRVGTDTSSSNSSSFIEFVPNVGLIVSSSNFFLNASSSLGLLKVNNAQIILGGNDNGTPTQSPTSYSGSTGNGAVGTYFDNQGTMFIGSGSVVRGSGNWISFGGAALRIRSTQFTVLTPLLTIDSTINSGTITLGPVVSYQTGSGVYMDGTGLFRVGSATTSSISNGYMKFDGNTLYIADIIGDRITANLLLINSTESGSTFTGQFVSSSQVIAGSVIIDASKISNSNQNDSLVIYSASNSGNSLELLRFGKYTRIKNGSSQVPNTAFGGSVGTGSINGNVTYNYDIIEDTSFTIPSSASILNNIISFNATALFREFNNVTNIYGLETALYVTSSWTSGYTVGTSTTYTTIYSGSSYAFGSPGVQSTPTTNYSVTIPAVRIGNTVYVRARLAVLTNQLA